MHSFGGIREPKTGGAHIDELINELMMPDSERRLGSTGGHAVMQHSYFGDGTVNWTKIADNEAVSPLLGVAREPQAVLGLALLEPGVLPAQG